MTQGLIAPYTSRTMLSIFRRAAYELLTSETLHGSVLDLGGGTIAEYHNLIKGDFKTTSLNIDVDAKPDIVADLEKPLAIPDNQYDGAILMNVIEHVFNYHQLLSETFRVLKKEGSVLIVVPFMFPIHPSPNDYHRFTDQALKKLLENIGFSSIKITPIAPGIMKVRHLMIGRHLPQKISQLVELPFSLIAISFDKLFQKLSKKSGKNYNENHYPLGYLVTATK